jgi:hypothetical protein
MKRYVVRWFKNGKLAGILGTDDKDEALKVAEVYASTPGASSLVLDNVEHKDIAEYWYGREPNENISERKVGDTDV